MKLMDWDGWIIQGCFLGFFLLVFFLSCVEEYDYLLSENVGSQNCLGWKGP